MFEHRVRPCSRMTQFLGWSSSEMQNRQTRSFVVNGRRWCSTSFDLSNIFVCNFIWTLRVSDPLDSSLFLRTLKCGHDSPDGFYWMSFAEGKTINGPDRFQCGRSSLWYSLQPNQNLSAASCAVGVYWFECRPVTIDVWMFHLEFMASCSIIRLWTITAVEVYFSLFQKPFVFRTPWASGLMCYRICISSVETWAPTTSSSYWYEGPVIVACRLDVSALRKSEENCCSSLESSSKPRASRRGAECELWTFTGNGWFFLWHSAIRANQQKVKTLWKTGKRNVEEWKEMSDWKSFNCPHEWLFSATTLWSATRTSGVYSCCHYRMSNVPNKNCITLARPYTGSL